MKSLSIILILFVSLNVYSQSNQDRFKKIFDQELADENNATRSSHSSRYLHTNTQTVPDWVTHIQPSTANAIYAVGISDPEMDSAQGLAQAIFRAEVMANLFRKSTTQLLCDFFLDEVAHSSNIVYEHYSRISAKMPAQKGNSILLQSFTNGYDETFVLISYQAPTQVDRTQLLDIRLELYKNETETSSMGLFESVYELKVNSMNDSINAFYELTELGQRNSVVSSDSTGKYDVPIYTLAYTGIPSADSVNTCHFTHGLWKEYFKSVMTQIMHKAREKPENISYLTDKYQVENYQKLTRGVSVNKMRFELNGFITDKGELKVKLTEKEL